ncbi:AAA family ATPase [Brucella pseudogrignonensis]|uniref:AAA family ATPase n=1 Tax=Brucella pseudogrignonensis TaxID=419475 RepID=UPI0038D15D58
MIVDISIKNFRSFREEVLFSMVAERGFNDRTENYRVVEAGKISVLRSAVIFGANASGKSNLLRAIRAIKWLITASSDRKDGQKIPPYEPYKLDPQFNVSPVHFEIEFIVPSGMRYRYDVSFDASRVLTESLYSYPTRQKALIFSRGVDDTWETIRFGAALKGGSRRLPFFPNSTYLSRAGNDASSPEMIQEIIRYFRSIPVLKASSNIKSNDYYADNERLDFMAELLLLADTNIKRITRDENDNPPILHLPDALPEEIKQTIIDEHKLKFSFWSEDTKGDLVQFEEDEISDGTLKVFRFMPVILNALATGSPIFIDELDGHLHTAIVSLLLKIFNDDDLNSFGSQLIFTTHDTNVLGTGQMRRDQLWFVSKKGGASELRAADSYDKKNVRADSPLEAYYQAGRFGAWPNINMTRLRSTIAAAIQKASVKSDVE